MQPSDCRSEDQYQYPEVTHITSDPSLSGRLGMLNDDDPALFE